MDVELKEKKRPENVLAGGVGAFLGSLLGVICIVVVGQMGYVASISGLVMAICALKGYELLAGGLSKKGAAISAVLVLVMTFVGHRLDWAVTVAQEFDVNLFAAFRAVGVLLEEGAIGAGNYWGGLALLYLFTLLGAVPTIAAGLKQGFAALPPSQPVGGGSEIAASATIYATQRGWMGKLRASMLVPILAMLGIMLAMPFLGSALDSELVILVVALGALVLVLALAVPSIGLLQADQYLLARDGGGTLWRVMLQPLNQMEPYRFTMKNGAVAALQWWRLSAEEQERAKTSITRAIDDLVSGRVFPGSQLSRVVLPLTNLEVVGEDPWRWRTTYETAKGRKKLNIAKAYPDLRPTREVAAPEGPMPVKWSLMAVATACIVCVVIGAVLGRSGVLTTLGQPGSQSPDPTASSGLPQDGEDRQTMTLGGATYTVSSALAQQEDHLYADQGRDATYAVSVEGVADASAALERLIRPISENRMSDNFETFQFDHLDGDWKTRTAEDGADYQYNILTVYYKDGTTDHTGVVFSPDGTLLAVDAAHPDRRDEVQVRDAVRAMLESAVLPAAGAQVEITQENYRSLFQIATDLGYGYVGRAYYKAPEEMFGQESFVDGYLPYGPITYSEDGQRVEAQAHGLRVRLAMTPAQEGAKTVVDAAYQAMVEAGVDFYQEGIYDTVYDAQQDIAYKQVFYFEEDKAKIRMAVLYADIRQENHYLSAEITYLTDLIDDETPALVAELRDVFAMDLPDLPAM